ncbi:tRNA (guanine-N(1)-)-methyltransferase [bacterium HR35]|nr:tRNA (guanine-N(1)-)-methyltransferase [bacterium HR35]
MRFDIITLFPEAFSYLSTSLLKRAQEKGIIQIKFWNPRDFTFDKHKTVDDRPYGGGPGMVLKFEPIYLALEKAKKDYQTKKRKIILTHPAGKIFDQKLACRLSQEKQLIIICGHYEGIDARIEKFVDLKISLGKFMLSGGEIPAMAIIDAVCRFLAGFLHNPLSQEEKRFGSLYSLPVYTRPEKIKIKNKILKVPKVLLSGNHKLIEEWRKKHLKKIL